LDSEAKEEGEVEAEVEAKVDTDDDVEVVEAPKLHLRPTKRIKMKISTYPK